MPSVTVLILVGLAVGGASAQAGWEVEVGMENDFFLGFSPTGTTDHEYTHGTAIRLRWIEDANPCPEGLQAMMSAEQRLHTPRDEGAGAGQRRYAGWLRIGVACAAPRRGSGRSYGLAVGVVGPAAGGEWAQRRVHEWFGFREPQGWSDQLSFRPEITGWVSQRWRAMVWPEAGLSSSWEVGGRIGSIHVDAEGWARLTWYRSGRAAVGVDAGLGLRSVAFDYLLQGMSLEPIVPLASTRAELGLGPVTVRGTVSVRGRSYGEEPGGFSYAGLAIGYHW